MVDKSKVDAFLQNYEALCRAHGFFASADDDGLPVLAIVDDPFPGTNWTQFQSHIDDLKERSLPAEFLEEDQ